MDEKLPSHVKAIKRRGRTYYYFKDGQRADGCYTLTRLPDIALPQFQHEYEVALAIREGREPPVWRRPDRSRVYFIGGEVGAIKIGWASRPDTRLRDLQIGSPIPLTLLATAPGGADKEREYHRRFAAHRLHGEWFDRHPDILAEIERLSASLGT